MDQKKQMIEQWQSGRYSKAELARRFGVSRTTVAGILQQQGLTVGPQRRRRAAPRSEPLAHAGEPNALW